MKKLLSILVLSLLFSGNAYAYPEIRFNCYTTHIIFVDWNTGKINKKFSGKIIPSNFAMIVEILGEGEVIARLKGGSLPNFENFNIETYMQETDEYMISPYTGTINDFEIELKRKIPIKNQRKLATAGIFKLNLTTGEFSIKRYDRLLGGELKVVNPWWRQNKGICESI
jgi:hypothetical protein